MTNTHNQTISVIGSGYVGVTTAAILANSGYKVFALEINTQRLETLKQGKSFFHEEYLNPLLKTAVDNGTLVATNSYEDSIPKSDIVFSCVGTPDNPDGSSNLSYVYAAAEESAKYLQKGAVYVQKSTVPVGTGEIIESILQSSDASIGYASNPEFLKEGTALIDSLWPDRVVIGGNEEKSNTFVKEVYETIIKMRQAIVKIAGINESITKSLPVTPDYIITSRNSAELIKVSANAFLALKISFANSIAKLADAAGADITEVMYGVGSDRRIGKAFLNAGRGYGGGCFPKDVKGLISSGLAHGVDLEIMQAVNNENSSMPGYILEKVNNQLTRPIANKKVAVLGAAFKAGTSDVRMSPAVRIANLLSEKMWANVSMYDPEAFTEDGADDQLNRKITIAATMEEALEGAELAVIATDWNEFKTTNPKVYAKLLSGDILVDAMNCLDRDTVVAAGLKYIGVGR